MKLTSIRKSFSGKSKIFLMSIPFIILILAYLIAAYIAYQENPDNRLLPFPHKMAMRVWKMLTVPDIRSGKIVFWVDTEMSMMRLLCGILIASITGFVVAINIAIVPFFRHIFTKFNEFFSMIPPLALLPIIMIIFGTGDEAKVFLIFIGTFFPLVLDLQKQAMKIPEEQIVKGLTLGAHSMGVVYRIIMPQMLPALFTTMRINLGIAWLCLIASEAVAASSGLGYRINLLARYQDAEGIYPIILWITILGFLIKYSLQWINNKFFPWYKEGE